MYCSVQNQKDGYDDWRVNIKLFEILRLKERDLSQTAVKHHFRSAMIISNC